jgi:hypothetical protein
MFPAKFADEAIKGYDINQLSPSPKSQAEEYYAE